MAKKSKAISGSSQDQPTPAKPPAPVRDVLAEHQHKHKRGAPNPAKLAVNADFLEPKKSGDEKASEDEDDTTARAPRNSKKTGDPQPHNLGFYSPHTKTILTRGKQIFRASVTADFPFPDELEKQQLCVQSFHLALRDKLGDDIDSEDERDLTDGMRKVVGLFLDPCRSR